MISDKVFLTANIQPDYDLMIESEKNIELILPFVNKRGNCNILVIEQEKNPQTLISKVIALLDETYHIVDSYSKNMAENVIHVNLDLRLIT